MNKVCFLAILLSWMAVGDAAAESPFELKLSANTMLGTGAGFPSSSIGPGIALEYKPSPRIGFEIAAASNTFESRAKLDFFGAGQIDIESSFRATPIVTRVNFHLTPNRRVDFYLGPVAGLMVFSDQMLTIRSTVDGTTEVSRLKSKTKDDFVWGGHLGLDVPFGQRKSFLTLGASYLAAVRQSEIDLDPLQLYAGIGFRF
jgi:outer membrane protein W